MRNLTYAEFEGQLSFATAFIILLLFIKIPTVNHNNRKSSFITNCFNGFKYIVKYKPMFYLIMLFAIVNLLSYMSDFSLRPALILARTKGDEAVLGVVSSFIGIAMLLGGIFVTIKNEFKNRVYVIFMSTVLSFLFANSLYSIGRNIYLWVLAAILGYFPVPIITANITVIMRTKVPIEKQGIVFAARNSMQFFTIPVGLFLGGFLADNLFEPFMKSDLKLAHLLSYVVGTENGSGIALMYLVCGIVGVCVGIVGLKLKVLRDLNE